MHAFEGKTALVTGASRGIGRGVALVLAQAGVKVFATGRSAPAALGGLHPNLHPMACDHRDDAAVRAVLADCGPLDLLVNNVWGGSEAMMDNGEFTWGLPFWQQKPNRWDAMFDVGPRAHFVASGLAAGPMVARGSGLIVNLSYWAAQKYKGDVAYGVAKAATDKLSADMACELGPHGVTSLTLYPGLVRTEQVLALAAHVDLSNSESPEFIGRAVLALLGDPGVARHNGRVLVAAALAREYGFTDLDGKLPTPLNLETA
ncbi:SDR family NAD(P)-dependent oxidoreductase [Massilia sp. TS11]|uniref:SDR family NAD(P)-dependent oxidoreductase n=1 Tax=Massilia sp. TS11 TaxID=2908003 RepID=UPI001EDB0827|nr:SDR family NAD(P)-dependent oxidoreductase [Massilia sp. TS11]MCG2584248.1 SDR family NAD(P)-dependent oxidoreductase [Massilia sp. TS11]